MKRQPGPYRHFIEQLNLSIERSTENVPNDGRFYVVREGRAIAGFRSLKRAEEKFRELVKESGYTPPVAQTKQRTTAEQDIERYLDTVGRYWSESHKFRERGGKGGRGGV